MRKRLKVLEKTRDDGLYQWGSIQFRIFSALGCDKADKLVYIIDTDGFDPIPVNERAACLLEVIKALGGVEKILLTDDPDWVPVELKSRKEISEDQ